MASSAVPAGHVQIILGGSATSLPAGLSGQQASAGATPTASPSTRYTADGSVSAASTALAKKAMAEYGIPCVY
jgi:hypothetical protein